jgi:hypothetical protein
MRLQSAEDIKHKLTLPKYNAFLKEHYPKEPKPNREYEWNPNTGSCGFHAWFTKEQLGVEVIGDEHLVQEKEIPKILDLLDKGMPLYFIHNYLDGDKVYFNMPKDNRLDSHVFMIVKGGNQYFLSQGFLHGYKHSLIGYTREELITMLHEIVEGLSDFDKTKTWSQINEDVYKKYFRVPMRINMKTPFHPNRKVNGIGLFYWKMRDKTRKISS